jgi:hypothetical protein
VSRVIAEKAVDFSAVPKKMGHNFGNAPGRNSSGVISYFSQSGAPLTVSMN